MRGDCRRACFSVSLLLFFLSFLSGIAYAHQPRIVSLGPYLTEEIYALQADDLLVGCTSYAPEVAVGKPKVGGVVDVSVERVLSLGPTLVLATSLTRPGIVKRLRELGIKVEVFLQPKDFREIQLQFMRLAGLVGREQLARAILGRISRRIKMVEDRVRGLPRVRVFVEVGVRPLFTANGDSFLNELVEKAGGVNVARDSSEGIFSREMVVKADPQVILIVTMGVAGEEELERWQRFPSVTAVRRNRIHVVDARIFCSPTPQNFLRALEITVGLLHPEVEV